MKSFCLIYSAVVLFAGVNVHAEIRTQKILDGLAVYCDGQLNHSSGDKAIKVELVSEKATQEIDEARLKVSVVKCENLKWVADKTPTMETYTAPNGLKVDVAYSNYELIFVNSRYEIVQRTKLEQLNVGVDQQDYSMMIEKSNDALKDLEVFVQAVKTVKVENGFEYSEPTRFGGFRVLVK